MCLIFTKTFFMTIFSRIINGEIPSYKIAESEKFIAFLDIPIAHAIEKAFDCNRCGISVIGLEVPHAHMHLVPINTANDLNFNSPKLNATPDELKAVQEKIKANIKAD